MDNAIVVSGLTKSFADRVVVNNISLEVRKGEVFGFLGPNGSGKTTTIRMLCGLLLPDEGVGSCLGWDIYTHCDQIKLCCGYMPQKFSYYNKMTVYENLRFVASLRDNVSAERINSVMDQFGLDAYRHIFAGSLSGGWKQRLSLAACLLHAPKLLFLDEPTAGVDPESRRYFWDVIHDLADQGTTVLVTTHYMDEAERCTRLAFINQGCVTNVGTRRSIIQQAGMYTFALEGREVYRLAKTIEQRFPDVLVVVFGSAVHVSLAAETLPEALERCIAQHNEQVHISPVATTIEHVFIDMVRRV